VDEIFPPRPLFPRLVPILDNMTYSEEADRLPENSAIGRVEFILLVDSTNFYLYEFEMNGSSRAGEDA